MASWYRYQRQRQSQLSSIRCIPRADNGRANVIQHPLNIFHPIGPGPGGRGSEGDKKTRFGINTFEATGSVGSEDGKDEGTIARECLPQVRLISGVLPGWDASQPDGTKAK